jgi:6-pyruvoyltetrahydropterin/6-carboxytetrahydropterin synthase
MKIHTERTFEAAHSLPFMPEGHKCRRLHGHSYWVTVEIDGYPDDNGLMVDYGEIAKIVDELDHRHLNEIAGLEKPTTENVVGWIRARVEALPGFWIGNGLVVRVVEGAHEHFAEFSRPRGRDR